jgi:hypothetical protein
VRVEVEGCGTEIRRGARRNTKVLFWNADGTDLTDARGFSTTLKIYGLLLIFWPLRDHLDYAENTNNSLNSMINIIKS